jgi:hypothetical protein
VSETQITGRTVRTANGLLVVACILALVGIGVSVLHFIWPIPLMFALFMIVGQGSFGLAMVLYLVVIFIDLRLRKVI